MEKGKEKGMNIINIYKRKWWKKNTIFNYLKINYIFYIIN